jgi:hypothetical protein
VSLPSHRCCCPRLAGTATAAPLNDPNGNCWVTTPRPAVSIEMIVPSKAPQEQATADVTGAKPLDVISPIVAQQVSATAGQPVSIDSTSPSFFVDKNQMHPTFRDHRSLGPQRVREPGSGSPG